MSPRLLTLSLLALAATSAAAMAETPMLTLDTTTSAPTAPDMSAKRVYQPLPYNEDWRWLAQPHSDTDFFDPIKNIPLGNKDLTLSIGGSVRLRYENRTNAAFGATSATAPTASDDYFLHRYYVHTDLRYRDFARLYLEGKFAYIEGQERNPPATPFPSDDADIHQAFLDLSPLNKKTDGFGLTVRIGRQELLYDKQKLVGPLDWSNSRRSFDGVKVMTQFEDYKVDLFWVRPVVIQPKFLDTADEETNFLGVHASHPLFTKDHNISVFAYYLNRTRNTKTTVPNTEFNPDLAAGNTDRVTLGSHLWGAFGPFDYDAEGGVQLGRLAGDDILAGYASLEGGYTFKNAWAAPRISLGYDYASGDDHAGDGKAGTFDQLFPTGHLWLGYVDLIGRQNIQAGNITLSATPCKDVKVWSTWHAFWLADSRDALYNAGGQAYRRSATGAAGNSVGNEFDINASWTIMQHTSLQVGYGVFFPGSFIENTGKSETVQMLFASLEYKF